MTHYYENIDGWFAQPGLYRQMVQDYDNAKFVEVGCYKGRSTSFMGVEIINSGKKIKLDCVDTFCGSTEHLNIKQEQLYNEFYCNIHFIRPAIGLVHIMKSVDAAKLYENNSLDFVFIDAAHDYDNVSADLKAWWPKIKVGGTIGGDDYSDSVWPGVVRGVNDFFGESLIPDNMKYNPHWFVKKKK